MVCANPDCKFCTTEAEVFHEWTNDELTEPSPRRLALVHVALDYADQSAQKQPKFVYMFGGIQLEAVRTLCADCVWQFDWQTRNWQKLELKSPELTPMELEHKWDGAWQFEINRKYKVCAPFPDSTNLNCAKAGAYFNCVKSLIRSHDVSWNQSSSASQIQPFVAIKEISVLEDQPGLLEDSELHDARVLINPNCEKIYFVTNSPRYSRDERCTCNSYNDTLFEVYSLEKQIGSSQWLWKCLVNYSFENGHVTCNGQQLTQTCLDLMSITFVLQEYYILDETIWIFAIDHMNVIPRENAHHQYRTMLCFNVSQCRWSCVELKPDPSEGFPEKRSAHDTVLVGKCIYLLPGIEKHKDPETDECGRAEFSSIIWQLDLQNLQWKRMANEWNMTPPCLDYTAFPNDDSFCIFGGRQIDPEKESEKEFPFSDSDSFFHPNMETKFLNTFQCFP